MGIVVQVAILAVEREFDSARFTDGAVNRVKPGSDFFKGYRFRQSEIQVFGKPIVAEVASLQRRPSFEGKAVLKIVFGKLSEKPSQAVVAFKDSLRDATAAALRETVGKERDVAL